MLVSSPSPVPVPDDPLTALMEGRYLDPETGEPTGVNTRSLVIADTLAASEGELVRGLGFGKRLAVVSDTTTHQVLGARIEAALHRHSTIESIVLPREPVADAETVENIRAASAQADALIAVGSGTINDLTKYASARDGKPYAVFATAPSMNGYTSLTASITQHGHKLTLPAQAPAGAFFDLAILAAAPKRMIRAGLGDSVCRTTAQTDWLLSHLLLGTSYRQLPFALLEGDEPLLLDMAQDLVLGNLEAMRVLTRTLVLSGFGTAIVGSSAPASQAEHLVSHYLDMLGPADRPLVFHGEQVGVTTLSIARLQQAMLETRPVLVPDEITEAEILARFGDELGRSIWPEFAGKRLDSKKADELNHQIATRWTEISSTLARSHISAERLEAVLTAAGAPTTPEAIHLTRDFYEGALVHGREIRNRYSVLDVMAASGRLEHLSHTI